MDGFIDFITGYYHHVFILVGLVGIISCLYALARNRKYLVFSKEKIVYTGDYRSKPLAYKDNDYDISGKPDFIEMRNGDYIPIEYKSYMLPPRSDSEKLQLASYFLMVEEEYKSSPPYGEIMFGDGTRIKVENTTDLKKGLFLTLKRMKEDLNDYSNIKRNHNYPKRCQSCKFKKKCPQRIDED